MRRIRIGGASGYWGDSAYATQQLLEKGKVDYLVYDYLAEVTMSLLANARSKSDELGYATDFVQQILKPNLKNIAEQGVKVVANAGGVNLPACQKAIQTILDEQGIKLKVGVVSGDNLLLRADEFRADGITEMTSGDAFPDKLASINSYLGAFPIAAALDAGADIVITGRVVDSATTLGVLIHEYKWALDDYDKLSMGSLAGHLIECGCQVTGGNFTDWRDTSDGWADMGYPIVECEHNGQFIITKPDDTGGLVSPFTVSEQLIYEIGDPQAYCLPDVVCDFASVTLLEKSANKILVCGAKGYPATHQYKVSATYLDGYRATYTQLVSGFDVVEKTQITAERILQRCKTLFADLGYDDFRQSSINLLGANALWNKDYFPTPDNLLEVVLRMSVHHDKREAVALFSREVMGVILNMTGGRCAAGAAGRPKVSPVINLYSFLLDKSRVSARVDVDGDDVSFQSIEGEAFDGTQVKRANVPVAPSNNQQTRQVQLIELAVARSGDKGDFANIGVIARRPEYMPYIAAAVTESAITERFSHILGGRVERFYLPGIDALNFLMYDALGGGGVGSMNIDVQGKTYAQQILMMPVDIPINLLDLVN
ncbi:MAG: terpene utilization protein AtuA [Piscirickettsiaceae bacterium]|nr:MAG: terpene utilization protein AtuA [Piscirickettsiaceae bacterium]PCI67506.1 MAG: terpene utilization protein AtuA [Piscirickettsiaceae bacterium]